MVGFFISLALLLQLTINLTTNLVLYTPAWMEFAINGFATLCFAGAALLLVKLVGSITEAQRSSGLVSSAFE